MQTATVGGTAVKLRATSLMTAIGPTIGSTLCIALLSLASSGSVSAQGNAGASAKSDSAALKELSLEELGNIEVTSAKKQPETVWQTASAIYVITQDDIRRSGATTLPDALRLAPGVIVNESDSNRWAVGVRGFADIFSKGVLVLIDGRSVYTPLVGGVHWAIQDVVLADIERIEVIRGPGGSLWGANATNGIINIITMSAGQTQGPRITVAGGNVEQGRASFRYGGSRGDRLDYRVYGKWRMRGAQFHPDAANFDDWRSVQSGFRTDWRGTPRDAVTVSGDIYSTRTGERGEVSSYTPPSLRTIDGTLDLTGGNLLARWERRFAPGSQTRLQAYYDRTNRQGFTFSEVRSTLDADFNVQHAPRKRNALAWGAGARVSPSTVTQLVPTLNFVPNEFTHRMFSAFVQDDITLVPARVSVSGGLKFEHNSYTGPEVLPSARVLWTPGPHQSVWASITRSVRTPSRFERDLRFQLLIDPALPLYLGIAGNADFESETVLGSEVGYRKLLARDLYLDVAAFHNAYDRLAGFGNAGVSAEAAPIPHALVTLPFVNSVAGRTQGFEITPDWKPAPFWQLKGSYSYLRLVLHNRPGFTDMSQRDNYVGLAPTHQVRVQSRVDLPGSFEVDQTYRYVSALGTERPVPAYHALDARIGWRFSPHAQLSVVGQNLLQPHHAEFNAVPVEIRRGVYAQLVLTR